MKRILFLFFICVLFAVSCTPAQSVVMPTEIPASSNTPTLIPARTSVVNNEEDDIGGISSIPSKTPIPSETPTIVPTFTITSTSTSQPSLMEHEWSPELVLISIRQNFGDGGTGIGDMGSPPLILYADGSMFISGTKNIDGKDYGQVLTKKLDRKEICQNLNTLDQIGYLDYDPSNYSFIGDKPLVLGAPTAFITVNTWKSKSSVYYYELSYFLQKDITDKFYGQKGYPIISPALRNTYYFLNQYPDDGFEVYKPNRLAVWMVPAKYVFADSFESLAKTWQLKSPSFENLLKRIDMNPQSNTAYSTILNGDEAHLVYDILGDVEAVQVFVIDEPDGSKKYYAFLARPLLPYEVLGEDGMSQIPASGSPKPDFKLNCHPSDGVLPISTPSN